MTTLAVIGMVAIAAALAHGIGAARRRRYDERLTGRRPR